MAERRVAWITGASSGIGEALAYELASRGHALILSGRRIDALERVAASIGGETLVLPFDAVDLDALPDIVERAWGWRGGIDLLVNNAGISQRSLAENTTFDVYRTLMEVDFFAPVRLTQLLLPRMIAQGGGHVAVVSSVAGKIGVPLRTGYCAAKHACVGYFEALRAEVERVHAIHVSIILPGSVRTAVAINALDGDGSTYGRTDRSIAEGMDVAVAARMIADGLENRSRDIVVAEGRELQALVLRAADPEALFARVALSPPAADDTSA